MKQKVDCELFRDKVADLQRGCLAPETAARLRRHADSCSRCAALMQLGEHVRTLGREDLEASVPDEYVSTMWERVEAEIASPAVVLQRKSARWRASRWLVPALAAASLVFLLTSGLLLGELKRSRAREAELVQRVTEQERRLASLDLYGRTDPVARTAGLASTRTWVRLLARRRTLSVAQLEMLVAGMPADVTVLSASEWRALGGGIPVWMSSVWQEATETIEAEDGIQAAELAELIDVLDLKPERSFPTARILTLTGNAEAGSS